MRLRAERKDKAMPDKVFLPPPILTPTPRPAGGTHPAPKADREGKNFAAHLAEAQGLRLSRHAEERLVRREIPLSPEVWGRVLAAVDKLAAKGGRDSLVLVGDLALLVNVPNRTVVTAVDRENMKERVFTNIDSAVIA